MKVIIVGGGIGGLSLGLFLKKANIECTIYEAYSLKEDVGGGLNIAPNGMNILENLGLAPKLYSRGSIALENCFRNETGKVIARYKNADAEKYGLPAVSITRYDLFDVLLKACQEQNINILFEKRLTDIKQDKDNITAFFADGTNATGDLLIGADGTNSKTRTLIFPDGPKPEYIGIIASGGVVKASDIPWLTTREKQSLNFTMGPKGFFGYMGIRDGDIMWWANLRREEQLTTDELKSLTLDKVKHEMSEIFSDFNDTVKTLILNTQRCVNYNIFDIKSLNSWHKGRVLLIGDAAHAVSPNAGQGASMALEDAMYLAKLFKNSTQYQTVFTAFESVRKARTEKIVAEGRRRGNDKQELTPTQSKIRENILKVILNLFGSKQNDWLYTYKINWDE